MNFEEMQNRWNELDRKLDVAISMSAARLDESALHKATSSLQPLARWVLVELLLSVTAVFCTGLFIARHIHEPKFLLPAIAVDMFAIFLLASCVGMHVGLKRNNLGDTIVDAQRRIETLKVQRYRMNKWALLVGPLLWVPVLIVFVEGVFGVDLYAVTSQKWLVANIVFGAAIIPITLWVAKKYGHRVSQSMFVRELMDDLAGRSLVSASKFLTELTRFEREQDRDAA